MKFLLRVFPWKVTLILSIITLLILSVLNFYGIYTNRFYFFKIDSYVFLMLAVVHCFYLYVVQFKIREIELPDPKMRNLEYFLYAILLVYMYKIFDSLMVLLSYEEYKNLELPESFVLMGTIIFGLYVLLLFLSLITFYHRKFKVGTYSIDNFDGGVDSWG